MAKKMRFDADGIAIHEGTPSKVQIKADPLDLAKQQVPVVTNLDELNEADQLGMTPTRSIKAVQETVNDEEYKEDLNLAPGSDIDVMAAIAEQNERDRTPIGLTNKLMTAAYVDRYYIVDNSGSMASPLKLEDVDGNINPTVLLKNAHPEVLKRHLSDRHGDENTQTMTRYEEAESRLHTLVDKLKYIPTGDWSFDFMNASREHASLDFQVKRAGKTPDQFAKEAHALISKAFSDSPRGLTPLAETLANALNNIEKRQKEKLDRCSPGEEIEIKTDLTIISDGNPTPDRGETEVQANEKVITLLKNRKNPEDIPVLIWVCGEEVSWTERADKDAPCVAVIDDYQSESIQVREKQGIRFPYTLGFYTICSAVGADSLNTNDLDAVDDNCPYSKFVFDNILGYATTNETYQDYLEHNINYFVMKELIPDLAKQLTEIQKTQLAIVTPYVEKWAKAHPGKEATLDNWLVNAAGYDKETYSPPKKTLKAFHDIQNGLAIKAPDRAAKEPGNLGIFGKFSQLNMLDRGAANSTSYSSYNKL